jgi:CHASE3 domain sensor protein
MITSDLRSPSLRAYLYFGVGSVGAAILLMFFGMGSYLSNRIEEQSNAQIRILSRHRAQQVLLGSLLQQEAGLQGYLVVGEAPQLQAYREGVTEQEEALEALHDNLSAGDRQRVEGHSKRLEAATDAWRHAAASAIELREKGPLKDLVGALAHQKEVFERVQSASIELDSLLSQRDDLELGQLEQTLATARWLSFGAISLMLLGGFFGIRRLIRRVTEPLVELSGYAHQGDGFPDDVNSYGVRELNILGGALLELDHRVRDREQKLKEEGEDAQSSQLYLALLQQLGNESEILEAFEQALRRMLHPEVLRVLIIPPDHSTLEWRIPAEGMVLPESSPAPRILGEPMACRTIRQGFLVSNRADSPTACLCHVGVPSKGSHLCLPLVVRPNARTGGTPVPGSRPLDGFKVTPGLGPCIGYGGRSAGGSGPGNRQESGYSGWAYRGLQSAFPE